MLFGSVCALFSASKLQMKGRMLAGGMQVKKIIVDLTTFCYSFMREYALKKQNMFCDMRQP